MTVKSFVIEGGVSLAYFSAEEQSRHVLVETADSAAAGQGPDTVGGPEPVRLETYIAQQLDFPNQTEFDAVYKRLADLRTQGLRPAADEPDITREDMKLRITVEVL
jgi:hypothetical protein